MDVLEQSLLLTLAAIVAYWAVHEKKGPKDDAA